MKLSKLSIVVALSLLAGSLSAANRVALVIGCSKYTNLPETGQLTSPVSDASDVADTLRSMGYTLVTGAAVMDAGKDEIISASEKFAEEARQAEAAIFYFSGHGIQVGEDNFLLPSDTPRISSYTVLKNRSVQLRDNVMVALEEAGAKTKVIILDCCRDNPFAAQLDSALAQVGKAFRTKSVGEISGYGSGFYLAFATSPGFTAADGNGHRNSPFTAALLKTVPTSAGKDIDFFFRDVKTLLGDDQVSWTNHSLRVSFAIDSTGAAAQPMAQTPASSPPPSAPPSTTPPASPPTVYTLSDIFDGTSYDGYNSYSKGQILRKAQAKLKNAGLYNSSVDGRSGSGTCAAIREWQTQNGLPPTGALTKETLALLSLDKEPEQAAPAPAPAISRTPATTPRPAPAGNYGTRVPGRPGFVYPPGGSREIDVRDFRPGDKARDPYSGRVFIVP